MIETNEPNNPRTRRTMRLAGEFAAIVIGVLFAMSLEAWWQKQQNVHRVDLYLDQLQSDIIHADSLLLSSKRQTQTFLENIVALNSTLGKPELPPSDSLRNHLLLALNFAEYIPNLGITRTLVETGDINLIEDTELRNQIIQFVTISASQQQAFKSLTEESLKAVNQFGMHVDLYGYLQGRPTRFPMDWDAIANNLEASSILRNMQLLLQNQLVMLTRSQTELRSLGDQLNINLEELAVSEDILSSYAGTFAVDSSSVVTLRANGERLFIRLPNDFHLELFPVTEAFFREDIFGVEVRFDGDSTKVPNALEIKMPWQSGRASRIE